MKYAPSPHLFFPPERATLARGALCAIGIAILAGCSTSKEAADTGNGATVPLVDTASGANGTPAGRRPPGSGRYIDPMISTTGKQTQSGQTQVRAGAPAGQSAASPGVAQNAFPAAPPSIAGMTTQPTGVQAGSFSIFSSAQPQSQVPAAQGQTAITGSMAPAMPPGGAGVSAARRSVFSSNTPATVPTCGTDAQGIPLSC